MIDLVNSFIIFLNFSISNDLTWKVNFPSQIPETILVLTIDSLHDHLRGVSWEDAFKVSASAPAKEFCEWVQTGINVYIPHHKHQVKSHSSP